MSKPKQTCPPHNFRTVRDTYRKPIGKRRVYNRAYRRWDETTKYAPTKCVMLFCAFCGETREVSAGMPA